MIFYSILETNWILNRRSMKCRDTISHLSFVSWFSFDLIQGPSLACSKYIHTLTHCIAIP